MTPEQSRALSTAHVLRNLGHSIEAILDSELIDASLRDFVREELSQDDNIVLVPARVLRAQESRGDWLDNLDRGTWTYWPELRVHLLGQQGWGAAALRSLDDSSDRVLRELASPGEPAFDIRGLVLGFVQSGKTANFTALIAKAADCGYRLVVVLSGTDNGLRRQTNLRLKRELVGFPDNRSTAVRMPPVGKQWHEFTTTDLLGDFHPGNANHAALQGSQPVLLVVKKNGHVLRRLIAWLNDAPPEIRRTLPLLVVDDEADQASVDTRGTAQAEAVPDDPEYEPPSIINGLIRDILLKFDRRAYVAYTATPFANILIPHDTTDPAVGNDLYPKDFIVDLPKPPGYFGAEEFFGRMDHGSGDHVPGIDAIREVSDQDVATLNEGDCPGSLDVALLDFALSGAARAQRGDGHAPATMLIHTSSRIAVQSGMKALVDVRFGELRDEWRYQRNHGVRDRLATRWEQHFRPGIRAIDVQRDVSFEVVEPFVTPFLEAVTVLEVNSETGEVLDYDREPGLKAIAVGGNRLSRGLTLEGLLVSYFVRRSATYDTLMQMGRWFGFRRGYEDLTRIYTTAELAGWFSDLAFVEHRLRQDISAYEERGVTPYQLGMRIWQHPTMQVTSPLKRRFSARTTIAQSYSFGLEQTFKFPLRRPADLARLAEQNRSAVVAMTGRLGAPSQADTKGPMWTEVHASEVLMFLEGFELDDQARSISLPLIVAYIKRAVAVGELVRWTIAVRGRGTTDRRLGTADWGLSTGRVAQVSRSRLGSTDSVGVIVDPEDEAAGMVTDKRGRHARQERSAEEGLLILYPISRWSGYGIDAAQTGSRKPLFDRSVAAESPDLVGLAISFPQSPRPQAVEAYLEGTVGWRPIE